MTAVAIVAARRTPQGRFLGALAKRSSVELACAAGEPCVDVVGAGAIDQVIVGTVLAAAQGMNVARQVGVRLGVPITAPAFTVNMMCASGMQACLLAADAIRRGDAEVVLCGGAESMSNAPFALERARAGLGLGDAAFVDTILRDGLVDSFAREHMGATAERLATRYGLGRGEQDAFAVESQRRHAAATAAGRFADELAPIEGLQADEHPRPDTTLEKLARLKPAFDPAGTVTAANSSGINDGAAMLVLCAAETARRRGWAPLAVIEASAAVGCDPALMGLGPVHAVRALCGKLGVAPGDFDAVELNEAFAAQALACIRELGLATALTNPDGGAIAVGHPIGATGARLLVHAAHGIARGRARRALATLCVGGGMGVAVALGSA
ncbi:MAG TPA: acetyl-CoA C-acyltransferase [Planctomycetota bacterium]|nr:acetyl-CoA C-acyltransferase [Planctomycetota bacterium]